MERKTVRLKTQHIVTEHENLHILINKFLDDSNIQPHNVIDIKYSAMISQQYTRIYSALIIYREGE